MHTGFFQRMRQFRHAIVVVAAALIVLQAAATGLAAADSLAAARFGGVVICHGAGGADQPDGAPSGAGDMLCCVWCMAAAPVMPTGAAPEG